MEYVEGAIKQAKKLDPNRFAIYVTHTAQNQKNDAAVHCDLILLNSYGGWGKAAQKAYNNYKKPVFMSEFGHNLNHEDPNKGVIDITKMMDNMRNREYLIGASLWTFNDYRSFWYAGSAAWNTPVTQNRPWGIVNIYRHKKRSWGDFRKHYSPLNNLKTNGEKVLNDELSELAITITPRSKMDIPAYKLENYKLEISQLSKSGKVLKKETKPLPLILPGADKFVIKHKVEKAGKMAAIKVDLVDPLGYNVFSSLKVKSAPATPKIKAVYASQSAIRVEFSKVALADGYYLRYIANGKEFYSDTTINNFIIVKKSKKNKKFKSVDFQVFAFNDKGVGEGSSLQKASFNSDELPPYVWETKAGNKCFYVGYNTKPNDYYYEVEYGSEPGKYTNRIIAQTKSSCRVPVSENGRIWYFRIRVKKQWGFVSQWTKEYNIQL